jgi:hypothetical protein
MPYKKNHCKSDWLFIKITRNSKLREWPIHRLVAEYYIPNEKNLPCVRHKNENITDNFAGNLEWVSHETLGKATAHKALGLPVLKIDVKTGHVLFEYKNMAEAGRDNYLHRETIRQVVRGIRKTAGGFYWRLANEDDFDYEEVYEEEA